MPKPLRTAEDIVALGKFRADAAGMLKRLKSTDRHLVITQNGEAAAVVLSPAEYDRMRDRQALLEDVATGISAIEDGQGLSPTQVRAQLEADRVARKR